jgi:hypothetical protein
MDEIAEYISNQEPPYPDGAPTPLPEHLVVVCWLRREAQRLIKESEIPLDPNFDIGVSRQSGGKGKRRASREIGVFVRTMVGSMQEHCSRPWYDAVASLANCAFPDDDLVAEDVRSLCRPRRRAGRRRIGAPKT